MEFRVLGRLEVWDADRELSCAAPKQRALLAVLLLHANEVVSLDRLIDELWGAAPPRTATVTLQNYVARLRKVLQAQGNHQVFREVLVTRSPGYLLRVDDGEMDRYRFERLATDGRQALAAGHAWRAGELLRAALSLWRGPAFADVALGPLSRAEADRLDECRISAVEARVEADLQLGRHLELVAELEALVTEHPLREHLHHQLMLALYRSGRQADALAVYHRTRQVLVRELGLEPSLALQQLERAILRADPELEPVLPTASVLPDEAGPRSGPCELPPDIDDFTGRQAAVAQVEQLMEEERATAVVISAIAGKAGVGKTALAVHVAHRLRPRFADGQLYVNLRGAEAQPLDPADVLAGFLRALGVQGAVIAEGVDQRVRQYRSRLADRRVLVVLDNAASEAQVRPLLPPSPGCAALVTSRARLSGLEAAHPLALDVLEADQAVALLAKLTGAERVASEPEAAAAIVRMCGWLPLAVRIAGARLASRPQWHLAVLAERLADERRRLDELTAGDLEVRASVALSYRGRHQEKQRLFRRLGLLAAPSFPAWVAATLLEVELAEAEELVEGLVDDQLVEVAGQDQAGQLRYRLHDLLRVFARERLHQEEPVRVQAAGRVRLLGDYLTLAERADALLQPSGGGHYGRGSAAGRRADHPALAVVERDPLGWFEAERASLVAAVQQAGDAGLLELCWRLADTLAGYFELHVHWDDWQQTHALALTAARRAGNRDAEGRILASLGDLHGHRRHVDDAISYLQQSLEAFREIGNRRGELQSLEALGTNAMRQGRFDDAATHLEQSLAGFRELGWPSGEAFALNDLSEVHREQGRYAAAVACSEQSLALMRAIGDRSWEPPILRRLALAHGMQGRFPEAVAYLDQSLAIARAAGDRHGEAYILHGFGEVHRRQGCLEDAADCLERGLALARGIGDRLVEAYVLSTLGDVRRRQGRLEDAGDCLERSLAVFREFGACLWEARTLDSLGTVLAARGDSTAARQAWHGALAIFRELGMPEATEVTAWLES